MADLLAALDSTRNPTEAGWGLERIGSAFDVLMKRLGYTRYVAQGGDWGAGIVEAMGWVWQAVTREQRPPAVGSAVG